MLLVEARKQSSSRKATSMGKPGISLLNGQLLPGQGGQLLEQGQDLILLLEYGHLERFWAAKRRSLHKSGLASVLRWNTNSSTSATTFYTRGDFHNFSSQNYFAYFTSRLGENRINCMRKKISAFILCLNDGHNRKWCLENFKCGASQTGIFFVHY